MKETTLVLMGAGSSSRFKEGCRAKKQWLRVGEKPLWLFLADRFQDMGFQNIIITMDESELVYAKSYSDHTLISGGDSRQASLKNAISAVDTEYVMVTDIARACIPQELIERLLKAKESADCIVPFIKSSDTVVYKNETIDRDETKLIQTPQLSKTSALKKALNTDTIYTDDSSAIKAISGSVAYIEGTTKGHKLTRFSDIKKLECLPAPQNSYFVGYGFDVHGFEDGKQMVLGGIDIEAPFGFKAHSDGDVAIHALIDAMLGAIGGGDIGEWFPDTSEAYKNIDSKILLQNVTLFLYSVGYEISNVDITVMAETPRLKEYKEQMKKNISKLIGIAAQRVNIKATTTEKLGFVGRKEGVAVSATVAARYFDWKNYESFDS